MAKKKKSLIRRLALFVVGIFLLTLVSVFLIGFIWAGPLIEKALRVYGPEAFGADVKVEDVSLGLLGGSAELDGLVIGNPEGYNEPVAIDAQEIKIRLSLRSLFTDTVVIEDILISSPVITYEKKGSMTNIKQLQLNATTWAESLSDKEREAESDEPSTKVVIRRFRIENGTLRVKLAHLPAVPIKLADIERTDIGGEASDAQNFGHAAKDILASLQLNASDAVENADEAIEHAAKEALKRGKDMGKDVLKAGEKALDDAGGKLKGLFGQ